MSETLYKGDCLIEMNKIADKSVDMILCDLPYECTVNEWDSIIPFDIKQTSQDAIPLGWHLEV